MLKGIFRSFKIQIYKAGGISFLALLFAAASILFFYSKNTDCNIKITDWLQGGGSVLAILAAIWINQLNQRTSTFSCIRQLDKIVGAISGSAMTIYSITERAKNNGKAQLEDVSKIENEIAKIKTMQSLIFDLTRQLPDAIEIYIYISNKIPKLSEGLSQFEKMQMQSLANGIHVKNLASETETFSKEIVSIFVRIIPFLNSV